MFLEPALTRPNLTVLTGTRVNRLRLNGGRVAGVEVHGPDGARELEADRVVLAAGAIATAQLLMLLRSDPPAGYAHSVSMSRSTCRSDNAAGTIRNG